MSSEREFLKEARHSKHMTMKTVSKLACISEGAYCNIERGKRNVSVPLAKRIAEILELDWTAFYEKD